jgi:gamma-glutamyl hercynylcysteine S-oxide hydrolase
VCRHLAYLGPPVPLGALLVDAPHALVDQARHPRRQHSGTENPDGYGVAWFSAGDETPRRYRTATPMWEDPVLRTLASTVCTPALLAAARLASPGSPVERSGNAPFVAGAYAWSLNGVVDGWHDGVGADVRARVSERRRARIEGVTDTETLFALALDHLDAGAAPGPALEAVLETVTARTSGRLNLLLSDGNRVAASAWGNSLVARALPGSVVIASEALDDHPSWVDVPDRTLVAGDADGLAQTPL